MKIEDIEVQIIKKKIKNINLRVHPDGTIKLSAPKNLPDHKIHSFLKSKIFWIKKRKFTKKEYVSGENHYFLGNKYKLNIIDTENSNRAEIEGKNINIYAKPESDKEKILFELYRSELEKQIPLFIKKWENKIRKVNEFRIRRMKTRWGSCSIKHKRICINLELAKRPLHCLEYVIVHEMTHLIEQSHNKNFWNLMTSFIPNWKEYRKELKDCSC